MTEVSQHRNFHLFLITQPRYLEVVSSGCCRSTLLPLCLYFDCRPHCSGRVRQENRPPLPKFGARWAAISAAAAADSAAPSYVQRRLDWLEDIGEEDFVIPILPAPSPSPRRTPRSSCPFWTAARTSTTSSSRRPRPLSPRPFRGPAHLL